MTDSSNRLQPDARHDLLLGLTEIVRRHAADPEAGGLAAVRALRAAEVSWAAVLPIDRWANRVGVRAPTLVTDALSMTMAVLVCGRLDTATPFQLAELAVLLVQPPSRAGGERATAICTAHNALLEVEFQAEVAALTAAASRA